MKRIIEIFLVTLGLALSAGCSEFLDTVPDNRTTIDTPKKISQLLATAYPDRTYMTLIEHRCDGYTDFGSTFQGMQPDAAFDNVVSAFLWDEFTRSESGNDTNEQYWTSAYNAIAVANHALEAIEKLPDPGAASLQKGEALLARAYWTMGKLDLAEDYAEKVIDSGKFPLMTTAEAWNAVETGTLNMQETVFGLYSTQYTYNFYRNHIYQGGTLALSSQYSEIYSTDLSGTDKRYSTWFDTGNSWCIKHYNKMYAQGESNPTYSGKSIPGPSLIRIPEMYYIVAEANLTKDPDKATEYLDYVVKSRDLTPFAERETGKITENNIINERRKEFFADGEDFFNMKRLQLDIAIPGGNFAGTDDATYTMPIPQSVEDNYRQ